MKNKNYICTEENGNFCYILGVVVIIIIIIVVLV